MYFADLDPSTGLAKLTMTPTRMRRLRVNRAPPDDASWLCGLLNREGADLGTRAEPDGEGRLALRWK